MDVVCALWRGAVRGGMAIALCGAIVGCSTLSGGSDFTYPPKERQTLLGDITVESRGEALMTGPPTERAGCEVLDGGFRWSDSTFVYAAALPVGCDPAFVESLNFEYELFRPGIDPSPAGMIGDPYRTTLNNHVCTNGCQDIPTVVGAITLDEPVVVDGVEYDVLNLYIDDSKSASDEMDDILANLQR